MILRSFFILIGFGLAVSGGISLIAYLNVFAAGMDYKGYFNFILDRPECYLFPVGILVISFSIFWPDKRKPDLQ